MIPNAVALIWAAWLSAEVAREEYTRFQSVPQGLAVVTAVVAASVAIGWLAVQLWRGRRLSFAAYGLACVVLWAASLTLGFVTSRLVY
jgi:hypothetical protein